MVIEIAVKRRVTWRGEKMKTSCYWICSKIEKWFMELLESGLYTYMKIKTCNAF